MKALYGTGVALITPFTHDLQLDTQALSHIVQQQIAGGIDYLVVLGTTAETATLTAEEKEEVIQTVIQANAGRLPLVLGVGGNHTQQVVDELQQRDLSAFTAILSVSPYYNKPTQEGVYQHFKAIAAASPIPVLLYNVPGRTACNMQPETVFRLAADCSNIIGIKEAAGDMVQAMRLIQNKPRPDFLVISGDDMITLPMVLAGGAGVISVMGEGLPRAFSDMVRLGLARQSDTAYAIHYALMPLIDLIFEQGNPAGIKALMSQLGWCSDEVRLPLVKADAALQARMAEALSVLKMLDLY